MQDYVNACNQNKRISDGDFSCCRHSILPAETLNVNEEIDQESETTGDYYAMNDLNMQTDQIVTSFFEMGEPDDLLLDLETVYAKTSLLMK